MEAFFEKLVRTLTRGVTELGQALPRILLAALKLDLLLLFFWYAWEALVELPGSIDMPHTLIAAPALLVLLFGGWRFIAVLPAEFKSKAGGPVKLGSLWPFLLLNLFPVLTIGIIACWRAPSHTFNSPLLARTKELIEGAIGWFLNL